jgi:pimeloyl-ACP methyl ester carboxylesterase
MAGSSPAMTNEGELLSLERITEHRLKCPDDLTLYLRDYAARGPEQGAPVLCLHGLTRNSKDFDGLAPFLASRGRRVLAMDVRGRGQSDWDSDPTRYNPAVYAGDVVSALAQLDIQRAVFVGTSMGGLITMIVAATKGDLVQAAVLNDIGPVIDPRGIARITGYVGNAGPFPNWAACAAQIKALQGAFYPDADDAFWLTFAHRCAKETDGIGHIVFDYDPAISKAISAAAPPPDALMPLFLALSAKPTLVVRGALSDILSTEGVAAMRAAKPDLDVCEVARVGHAPTLDEPAARDAIAAFLATVG